MKKIVIGMVVAVLASWVVFPSLGFSTAEIAKKENNEPCKTCHVKPMKGDENLTDFGKCYKEKKDMAACKK